MTTTAIKNPMALPLIIAKSIRAKSPELVRSPATTVRINNPKISSTTAAPIIVLASFVFKGAQIPQILLR